MAGRPGGGAATEPPELLEVSDAGQIISFTCDDLMTVHGGHSPAGVAIAFQMLRRAIAVLSPGAPPPRRAIVVRTAFRGPGARDAVEAVARGCYTVDRTLVRPDRGRLLEDFVFEVSIAGRGVTLLLRDGFVTEEFIDLARTDPRTADQERRLDTLKARLAQRVLRTPADQLFDIG